MRTLKTEEMELVAGGVPGGGTRKLTINQEQRPGQWRSGSARRLRPNNGAENNASGTSRKPARYGKFAVVPTDQPGQTVRVPSGAGPHYNLNSTRTAKSTNGSWPSKSKLWQIKQILLLARVWPTARTTVGCRLSPRAPTPGRGRGVAPVPLGGDRGAADAMARHRDAGAAGFVPAVHARRRDRRRGDRRAALLRRIHAHGPRQRLAAAAGGRGPRAGPTPGHRRKSRRQRGSPGA